MSKRWRFPGLRFRFFDTPVRIGLSFPIAIVALPFIFGGPLARDAWLLGAWLLLVTVSVLVHEGGHVTALRAFGFHPQVSLNAMGGLTSTSELGRITPKQSIIVSVAGPLAAIVLGFCVHAGLTPIAGQTADWIRSASWFVNIGWSLFNLLPIMPLDGGHIMREFVEATSRRRDWTVALLIGAALTVAGVVWAAAGSRFGPWLALALVVMVATNFRYFAFSAKQRRRQAIEMAHEQLLDGNLPAGIATLLPVTRSREDSMLHSGAYTTLAWALLHERRFDDLCGLDPERFHHNHRDLLCGATAWFRGDVGHAAALVSNALATGTVDPPETYFHRVFGRIGEMDRLAQTIALLPADASARAAQRVRRFADPVAFAA